MAMTADGKIARHRTHFTNWTGAEDKRMFKRISEQAGVVIMGANTFSGFGKPLPNRLNVVLTRQPEQYQAQSNLVFTAAPPRQILKWLSSKGYQSAILAGGATINSLFLRAGLIDEMIITIVPLIFGEGISLFAETTSATLTLLDSWLLETKVQVLHYRIDAS